MQTFDRAGSTDWDIGGAQAARLCADYPFYQSSRLTPDDLRGPLVSTLEGPLGGKLIGWLVWVPKAAIVINQQNLVPVTSHGFVFS
jgi:hypothetical protein